jgi:SAM-dependent methyltransferase
MGDYAELGFDPGREERELTAFLGDAYDRNRLERHHEVFAAEFAASEDEPSFYRSSESYLYDLTAFAMTGIKLPYLRSFQRLVPGGARILDYGCGIGSDGLMLLEAGYEVEFADFANPSTEYLRWRLKQRGIAAPVHDLDQSVPGGFDAAYSFDVIEHVRDPFAFLAEMESRAGLVQVNFLEPDELDVHHDLPLGDLRAHVAGRDMLDYRIFYGRSHLASYRPGRVGPARRAANLARAHAARLRRHSESGRS